MPKAPNQYWVNPALFFKGDRVAFVKEYRRRGSDPAPLPTIAVQQRSEPSQPSIPGMEPDLPARIFDPETGVGSG